MQEPVFSELLNRYTYVNGEMAVPCVPALLETYMGRLEYLFISLGKPFSKADLVKLRELLTDYLQQGFQSASTTYLNIKYRPTESPDTGINYTISYALNPDIQPPHNNREIEMRVPAMLGMKSKNQAKGLVQVGGKTSQLQILKIGTDTGLENPLATPSFLKDVNRYAKISGEIVMPCMPSLLNTYLAKLDKLFIAVGKAFSKDDLAVLRKLLQDNLLNGFNYSPLSKIVIHYESAVFPNVGVNYRVAYSLTSIAEQYKNWVDTRTPPLFGKSPDAKVMDTIANLGDPSGLRVLDIGAGTGRNILPLAKIGCKAEALELAPALVQQLENDAKAQNLGVKAIVGDVLDPMLHLSSDSYNLIICAEVVASHFRNVEQIHVLLDKVSKSLCHGGLFLFNLFVAHDDYQSNPIAREFSEVVWSSMFTNQDLMTAFTDLPLEIISNESVFEYEHNHLPSESWPPTGWFEHWSQGRDLFRFEESKMELRWVLCKRV